MKPRPDIAALRTTPPRIVVLGSHRAAVQSILDFDALAGRTAPTVAAILATGRRSERYFFGGREVSIPVVPHPIALPDDVQTSANLFLNVLSGRRVVWATLETLSTLPNLAGGVIFAERLPERSALELARATAKRNLWLIGGASTGLLIPGALKLGPIGGVEPRQLIAAPLHAPGSIAVIGVSGGITNELIHLVTSSGHLVSFAASVGGERFPLAEPADLLLAAEADPATTHIVYFGELGGADEYKIAELMQAGNITKPVLAYVAGTSAELFPEPPQFGHAGALAQSPAESASAKSAALATAGAYVAPTFAQLTEAIMNLPKPNAKTPPPSNSAELEKRPPAKLFASTISRDREDGSVEVLGHDLLEFARSRSFANIVAGLWLGQAEISPELERTVDFILRVSAEHGPYQAAAVNTMVAARAGINLTAALASGLLTIGPRFGGAINQSAAIWLAGVRDQQTAAQLVESLATQGRTIAGIGHRKYSRQQPDPRVAELLTFTKNLKSHPFSDLALAVEAVTTAKKSNLILNVDGAIAAVLLDLLHGPQGYDMGQLEGLVNVEFFNAFFILSRSVGLMAHYFDQLRLDEGLFRLGTDYVAFVERPNQT
jgi:ATP citrate (pro-S)-lyase